jgi:hypothetical protein
MKYRGFTGRNATRAFCAGCLEPGCLIAGARGLDMALVKEAARWFE